jgi:hypothetical protein
MVILVLRTFLLVVLLLGAPGGVDANPPGRTGGASSMAGGNPLPPVVIWGMSGDGDQELCLELANPREADLGKGLSFRIRIEANGRKVSDFEHLSSAAIKGGVGSRCAVRPPSRVEIAKRCRVRASVGLLPGGKGGLHGDHRTERTFLVFPFRLRPGERREVLFSFSLPGKRTALAPERVKAEIRWDGGGAPLLAGLGEEGRRETVPVSGRSPLRLEKTLSSESLRRRKTWKVGMTNLMAARSEGRIIVQHP